MSIRMAAFIVVAVWLLICLAYWAGFLSAGRALPRPTGQHRRPRGDWHYARDDEETPSPLPVGVVGYAPTGPRGAPNWTRWTEPLPMIGDHR